MFSRVMQQTLFGAAVGGTFGLGLGYAYGLLPHGPRNDSNNQPVIQLFFLFEELKTILRNTSFFSNYSYAFGALGAISGSVIEYYHSFIPSIPEFREPTQRTLPAEAKFSDSVVDEDGNFVCPISKEVCDKIVCCKIAGNERNFYQLVSLDSFKSWYTRGRPNYSRSDGTIRVGYGEVRSKIDELFVITQDEFKRHRNMNNDTQNTPVASLC